MRGADAIALSILWQPHVIVLDISMPVLNGFDIARSLRQGDATRHIAIIAFTALDESEVLKRMTSNEFDGYCRKGEPPSALSAFIKSAFP